MIWNERSFLMNCVKMAADPRLPVAFRYAWSTAGPVLVDIPVLKECRSEIDIITKMAAEKCCPIVKEVLDANTWSWISQTGQSNDEDWLFLKGGYFIWYFRKSDQGIIHWVELINDSGKKSCPWFTLTYPWLPVGRLLIESLIEHELMKQRKRC